VSFKPLFLPQFNTRVIRIQAIPEHWYGESMASSEYGFMKLWLKREDRPESTINWGAISGLAISLAVSAGFWAGVAILVHRVL
jgi:hypothetical protein